ncbi:[protein-PII] uridylyltransferase [Bosea sp. (in: a-proteobacteria)]|uniref:[protein-PII] uridylyltransferase n=1 Tax=Bosea sp. (in: a-proteobacteria) TaxID=1871050 RepID=UPI00260924E8|nr:[protein-PII] uridylyltransferase [Bosea sp. (in: a-proteobacteria)]MCO5091613.1 [protein-PII] uridylyltransferase [Bosea sp. (in: a-proteobacteria)]
MLHAPEAGVARLFETINRRDKALMRQVLMAELRQVLDEGHASARAILAGQRGGLACARRLSAVMDAVMRALHGAATGYFYPADNPSQSERIAVVAVGGYGRGTLAPGSDVDLLFLFPHKQTAWGESVVESMLYPLWDLKLKTGHSVRSIDDCVREARADMTIRTALLEARFLAGDRPLFEAMVARFEAEVVEGTAAAFTEAKLAERELRVQRAGASRYLVEPNVKDGKGGLRDLNTLFWIAKYSYRIHDVRELVGAGLFDEQELLMFQRSEEFLWRVRCWLHFITGRAEERLSFDLQRQVAAEIGYAGRRGQAPVERFMKAYFLIAKDVGDLTAIVCAALEARQQKPRATLSKLLDSLAKRKRKRERSLGHPDFRLTSQRLDVVDDGAFERDPVNLLRLYAIASREDLAIHPDASRLVTQSLRFVTPALRNDPEANRIFLEIVTGRRSPEVVLRRMNESGLLGRFVPDFGRIVAMMQFNMYHHYTVDEHLIRAMGILAEIDAGVLEAEHPLSNEIMPTIANRRALYVALLLHDIAKGRAEDHSIAGARIARKLGPRFGLTSAQTETVAWLVEHHLDMSTVAQSRDLGDPKTIESFAATVQTLERLKLLLILTVADIKAVGPGVWNGWKGQLLRTLYYETELVLTGGHSAVERKARVRQKQDELRRRLPDWSAEEREAYIARHYPAYWIKVDPEEQEKHARFLREAEAAGRSMATIVETDEFRGVTVLTVLAPDHPRLLAIVTGACAASGGNIADAQIFTTSDGLALDTIAISRAFERDDDELRRAERIADAIERALKGEIRIADLVAERRAPPPRGQTFQVAPEVIIDNVLAAQHSVLEVSGLDRPGLLYDLTTAIGKLNLNIASAHIATFGEKAVDVFYVTDLTQAKIVSTGRQLTIRKALLDVFKLEAEKPVQAKAKLPPRA